MLFRSKSSGTTSRGPAPSSGSDTLSGSPSTTLTSKFAPSMRSISPVAESATTMVGLTTAIGTRFIATPEARAVNGYKETLLAIREDDTVISKAFTGKTCRVVRNEWTNQFEQNPGTVKPFPEQAVVSMKAGVNHLGYPSGTEVDVQREFMPCGQGVGAIHELTPAREIVHAMVAEAERAIERIAAVRR